MISVHINSIHFPGIVTNARYILQSIRPNSSKEWSCKVWLIFEKKRNSTDGKPEKPLAENQCISAEKRNKQRIEFSLFFIIFNSWKDTVEADNDGHTRAKTMYTTKHRHHVVARWEGRCWAADAHEIIARGTKVPGDLNVHNNCYSCENDDLN